VVLQPLLGAGIFQVLFGLVAKTPSDGIPPFVFYYAGFMAYKTFESTLTKASACMIGNAGLVSKVYFPRLILPLSTAYSTLVDFGVSLALLAVLMIAFRVALTPAVLLLPLWFLLLQMVALGLGFFFAALTVRFRDVQYALPVLIQFGLYASPVAYSVSFVLQKLPAALQPLVSLNPLTGLLDGFRWSVLGTPLTSWGLVAYSACAACLLFVWGAQMFSQMEQSFADVI
jgi:lipopolysaccharide transport system permease protein